MQPQVIDNSDRVDKLLASLILCLTLPLAGIDLQEVMGYAKNREKNRLFFITELLSCEVSSWLGSEMVEFISEVHLIL